MQAEIRAALAQANTTSVKVTLTALLGRATGPADNLRQYAIEVLGKLKQNPLPIIGLDLTTNSYRPLFQVLTELAI